MAEKKKKQEKLVAKVNNKVYEVEFIKDFDGGRIKKGTKARFGASTAMDYHMTGYIEIDPKIMIKDFPETKKFIEENEEHVKSLRDTNKYD